MSVSVHDIAEKVGISRAETDSILKDIFANNTVLASCAFPHDLSIAHEIRGTNLVTKFKCSKCGGIVRDTDRHWYVKALEHCGIKTVHPLEPKTP
jgi:predicted RNA-binding Zn-ribbon protein involved in translation (DUF1610 family)